MQNTLSRTGVYGIAWQEDKLLLIKQKKGPHAGKFDLPGGGIEMAETIEEALRREFQEEVGMTFVSMKLFANFTAVASTPSYILHQIGLIYLVDEIKPLYDLKAELEYFWIAPDVLIKEPISPFVEQMLRQIHQ